MQNGAFQHEGLAAGQEKLPPRHLEMLQQDLVYAGRTLLRNPGFTFIAVLTLAFGIGINTAIFSLVQGVLLNPLSFADSHRLVRIWSANTERGWLADASLHDFEDWRAQSSVLEQMAVYALRGGDLLGVGEPRRTRYALVSEEFFSLLGVELQMGRFPSADENKPGKSTVVMASHAFWQQHLRDAEESPLGKTLSLNGENVEIIGVMAAGFRFPGDEDVDLWKPLGMTPEMSGQRNGRWLKVIGRLAEGTSLTQAQSELNIVSQRLASEHPATNENWETHFKPLQSAIVGDFSDALMTLWAAAGIVLLITCTNVANLLLARSATRRREVALRTALGADRQRLIRQLLSESLLLATLGGAVGLLLAALVIHVLPRFGGSNVPRLEEVGLNIWLLLFALGLSVLTGIFYGLAPALSATKVNLADSLKEGSRGSGGSGRHVARSFLVVAEVALAMAVLIGTGLLVRSLASVLQLEAGFETNNLLTLRIEPPWDFAQNVPQDEMIANYMASQRRTADFYQELRQRLDGSPGIRSTAAINNLPLSGNRWVDLLHIEHREQTNEKMPANSRVIVPGYFQTMGIPLIKGRHLTDQDNEDSQRALIVNQAAVDKYWPGEDPIGQRVTFEPPQSESAAWYEVVGVVGDVRHNRMEIDPSPMTYRTLRQARGGFGSNWGMDLVLKTETDPLNWIDPVRREILSVRPNLPVFQVRSMEQVVNEDIAQRRFNVILPSLFAALSLVLATIGIYGVISYSVAQRTQEMGIRLALGAPYRHLIGLILTQGMAVAGAGLLLGVVISLIMTRFLASFLFNIGSTDPGTFIAACLLITFISLVACYIPARRATKIDPISALRAD